MTPCRDDVLHLTNALHRILKLREASVVCLFLAKRLKNFFWSKFTQDFFLQDKLFHYWKQCVSITLKWCGGVAVIMSPLFALTTWGTTQIEMVLLWKDRVYAIRVKAQWLRGRGTNLCANINW